MAFIDLRSREIAEWRSNARTLAARLADIQEIAEENDHILLTLHQLALLLIKKQGDWRREAEKLLRRRLSLVYCEWHVFSAKNAADVALARAVAKLPAGGRAMDEPLTPPPRKARAYFCLPLPGKKQPAGLLTLASRHEKAFAGNAADDFARRLAELLAAAG